MSLNKLNSSLQNKGIKPNHVNDTVKLAKPLPVVKINNADLKPLGLYHFEDGTVKSYKTIEGGTVERPKMRRYTVESLTIKVIDKLQNLFMLEPNNGRLAVSTDYDLSGLSHIVIKTVANNATETIPDRIENGKAKHGKPSQEVYKSFWDVDKLCDLVSVYGYKNGIKVPILTAYEKLKPSDNLVTAREKQKQTIQLTGDPRKLFNVENEDYIVRVTNSGKIFINTVHCANIIYSPNLSEYWVDLTEHGIAQYFNGDQSPIEDGTFTLDDCTMNSVVYRKLLSIFMLFSHNGRTVNCVNFRGDFAYIGKVKVMQKINNPMTANWVTVPLQNLTDSQRKGLYHPVIKTWIGTIIANHKLVNNIRECDNQKNFFKKYVKQFLNLNHNYTVKDFNKLLFDHGEDKLKRLILNDKAYLKGDDSTTLKIPDLL